MKTLAITGSSGSGKTMISQLFLRFEGTYLINTDELARDMAENDKQYLNDIILSFGKDILDPNRSLNRRRLSVIIAESEDARKELNRITKKNIMPKIEKAIEENKDKKLIVVDVPILYENQLEGFFDKVLAVVSDKEEQIRRIEERDGLEELDARARLKMQNSNEFFKEKADFVIENIGKTKEDIYKEVISIYLEIMNEGEFYEGFRF